MTQRHKQYLTQGDFLKIRKKVCAGAWQSPRGGPHGCYFFFTGTQMAVW